MMALRIKRAVAFAILLFSLTFASAAMVFARPEPFFAFSRTIENVTIYDVNPIPNTADVALHEIVNHLNASPFEPGEMSLFVANDGWRYSLYFFLAQYAGGVVYYPVTQDHGFLSGADYQTGLLTKGNRKIRAPRTLAYYGSHELTHIMTGQKLGAIQYHMLPEWVREGIADYVALGAPQDYVAIDKLLGDDPISLQSMETFGTYPRYRLLVSWFLEEQDWTLDALLETDMSENTALAEMRQDLYQ